MVMTSLSMIADASAPCSPASSNQDLCSPKATLACMSNSHQFQDRTLSLDQPVKIGRSVARAKPAANNGIFDCKVLSRNHAVMWYEDGKFYLKDTKSSNGTFVNNQRLVKGSQESLPREVCTGDILQFGVEVMENARNVTHGCIIATLRLYYPDGREAKANSLMSSSSSVSSAHELYQLNQYIQEALAREQVLENKLGVLKMLLKQTENASSDAWKSLIEEDRLLTRVEILESLLSTYGNSMSEDKLREETKRLMEEKTAYQETAKETLKKLVDEKLEAISKMKELELTLNSAQYENFTLKDLYNNKVEENRKLVVEVGRLSSQLRQESDDEQLLKDTSIMTPASALRDQEVQCDATELEPGGHLAGEEGDDNEDDECVQQSTKLIWLEMKEHKAKCIELCKVKDALEERLASTESRLQEALELIHLQKKESECDARDLVSYAADADLSATSTLKPEDREKMRVAVLLEENQRLSEELNSILQANACSTATLAATSPLDGDGKDAEIEKLLIFKEKYVMCQEERSSLQRSYSELEGQLKAMSHQMSVVTTCAVVPILIVVVAIVIAYLPVLSLIFCTSDNV